LNILQCDGWINEAGQFLLNIGRKATECKTSSDAADLISQLSNYKEEGGANQNERLNGMELIATGLYGEFFTRTPKNSCRSHDNTL
jgi:hypothetical protein